jgi:lipopolysaccharide transport system ATP-binding protein
VASDDTAVFIDVVDDAVVFQMARWNVARVWSKVHLFPTFQIQKIYPYD